MIFDLIEDYADAIETMPKDHLRHRMLTLLDEALRRDIHFIDRHPTTLFQCMWNTCWWYDCEEARKHFVDIAPRFDEWQRPLSSSMEYWQTEKQTNVPGFRWLRSLRPPQMHLGTSQTGTFTGHQHWVSTVAISPDGRFAASGSYDTTVRIWHMKTGAEVLCLNGHSSPVTRVCFSSDGTRLASGDAYSDTHELTIRQWDIECGDQLSCHEGPHTATAFLCYSPDGRYLYCGGQDEAIRVWDAKSGGELHRVRVPDFATGSLALSPNGRHILAKRESDFCVWDIICGEKLLTLPTLNHVVGAGAFSPDGRKLAVSPGSRNGPESAISVVCAETGVELCRLEGHEDRVTDVLFSPCGNKIVSSSEDSTVRVWSAKTGDEMSCLRGHLYGVTSISILPNGHQILSGSVDHTVRLWDLNDGEPLLPLRGPQCDINCLSYSPDERVIVTGSSPHGKDKHSAHLWDANTGELLDEIEVDEADVRCVKYSPQGNRIYAGSSDFTVRMWTCRDAEYFGRLGEYEGSVRSISISRDGLRLAIAAGIAVLLLDAEMGTILHRMSGHQHQVYSVAFSPDGNRIVSGSRDSSIRIWDVKSGVTEAGLYGHEGPVSSVSFTSSGDRIISLSEDRTVRVWDIARGECIRVFRNIDDADIAKLAKDFDMFGANLETWHILSREQEVHIEYLEKETAVAYLPLPLYRLATSSGHHRYAGVYGRYLATFQLEGNTPKLAINGKPQ